MYYLFSSLFMLFLGLVWKGKDVFNIEIKFTLLGLSFWGLFNYLALLGYLVKG
jgi:hypothetical protein